MNLLRSIALTALRRALLPLAIVAFTASASAQILTINVSQPDAVVFTGTGAFASTNYSSNDMVIVALKGFFTSSAPTGQFLSNTDTSTLIPAGSSSTVTMAHPSYQISNWPNVVDLELSHGFGSTAVSYTTTTAALLGYSTFNLSGYALPSAGATGNVYGFDYTTVIGTYVVTTGAIPEPATYALGFGAFALLGALLHRRRLKQS
ncbi:hypothetical protein K0B96_12435 [Horticoccus luteus]|uniref:Secreted protein with PEP-CTERM sorting signal n=1 Tax=Horticoccus luteus TaxID=2862869 RepID=A0A8F9XIZ5_9BACT|nr:PEP-CTERM sorting domain-containing protein [Horticoccus luteus]QYM78113.1 hypothetical protein K0B96_12435 [Horticoccus luteus]